MPLDHNEHDHHEDSHGHSHGLVDSSIVRSRAGVRAVSLSFAVLFVGAMIQLVVFGMSGSVALLTDVIHNAGDSLTAIPLGLAFLLRSRRGERWAGYGVVTVIGLSALLALYEAIQKVIHPSAPSHLLAMFIAGVVGIAGNELAAVIRWRAGRRLDSPALIADGNHARADGIVSGGVILSAVCIALGFPLADPLIGLAITGLIFKSTWDSWRTIRAS